MHIIQRSSHNDRNDPKTLGIIDFFKCFYQGFAEDSIIWFAYHDENTSYENPFKFQLDSWKTDEDATKSMKEMISPRILPTNFTSGNKIPSYKFYNPSVATRQLGFGQVPSFPFFAGKVQFRGTIGNALSYDRLKDLEPSVDMALLADWKVASFATTPFTQW